MVVMVGGGLEGKGGGPRHRAHSVLHFREEAAFPAPCVCARSRARVRVRACVCVCVCVGRLEGGWVIEVGGWGPVNQPPQQTRPEFKERFPCGLRLPHTHTHHTHTYTHNSINVSSTVLCYFGQRLDRGGLVSQGCHSLQ